MNFISTDKVKWYDWIWLVPTIMVGFIYSALWMTYAKFLAYCMDKK
jgi:hypothetical protein